MQKLIVRPGQSIINEEIVQSKRRGAPVGAVIADLQPLVDAFVVEDVPTPQLDHPLHFIDGLN